jgi:hypothetical protein
MRFVFISTMAGSPWGGSEELWSQTALRLHESSHRITASVISWPQLSSHVTDLMKRGLTIRQQ